MSYGGSVLAMIISLKNNALQRRKPFENLKENSIHYKGKLALPRKRIISEQKLLRIKAKIQRTSLHESRRQTILAISILLVLFVLGFYFTLKLLN